jgi:hypothetical protein
MKKQRTPYRPDQGLALSRIESRRLELAITQEDLCGAAALSNRTYRRMLRSGRGFDRHIRSLRYALRTLELKQRAAEIMFDGEP